MHIQTMLGADEQETHAKCCQEAEFTGGWSIEAPNDRNRRYENEDIGDDLENCLGEEKNGVDIAGPWRGRFPQLACRVAEFEKSNDCAEEHTEDYGNKYPNSVPEHFISRPKQA